MRWTPQKSYWVDERAAALRQVPSTLPLFPRSYSSIFSTRITFHRFSGLCAVINHWSENTISQIILPLVLNTGNSVPWQHTHAFYTLPPFAPCCCIFTRYFPHSRRALRLTATPRESLHPPGCRRQRKESLPHRFCRAPPAKRQRRHRQRASAPLPAQARAMQEWRHR